MKRNQSNRLRSSKKSKNKKLIISLMVSSVCIIGLVVWIGKSNWDSGKSSLQLGNEVDLVDETETDKAIDETRKNTPPEDVIEEKPEKKKLTKEESVKYIEGQKLPSVPTYIKDILVASKKYPLPSTFAPGESKEARDAFEELAAEAVLEGFQLTAFSTYRSFEYQTDLYKRYVDRDGEEAADRYSARPGYSEHQTGLAFDIGEVDVTNDWASERFGETEAGKWIAAHAHRFGFIMRYPEGKEFITGYMHESWHFRYVGVEIAKEIYKKNLTLEEYLDS